jgi:hypothetical protein
MVPLPSRKMSNGICLLGHAGKGAHAGYGKQWIETLKAAIEVIPNPFEAPLGALNRGPSGGS